MQVLFVSLFVSHVELRTPSHYDSLRVGPPNVGHLTPRFGWLVKTIGFVSATSWMFFLLVYLG